jgi:hypothetical protein
VKNPNRKYQIAKLIGSGFKMLISETLYAIVWIGGFNPSQNNKFQATSTKIQNDKAVWVIGY